MQTRGGENQAFPVSTREKKKDLQKKSGEGKAVTGTWVAPSTWMSTGTTTTCLLRTYSIPTSIDVYGMTFLDCNIFQMSISSFSLNIS